MTDLWNVENVFTYTELSTKDRFAIWDFVILQACIPRLRIGKQFDDVSDKTNASGGAVPSFPKIEFNDPKKSPFALWKLHFSERPLIKVEPKHFNSVENIIVPNLTVGDTTFSLYLFPTRMCLDLLKFNFIPKSKYSFLHYINHCLEIPHR